MNALRNVMNVLRRYNLRKGLSHQTVERKSKAKNIEFRIGAQSHYRYW